MPPPGSVALDDAASTRPTSGASLGLHGDHDDPANASRAGVSDVDANDAVNSPQPDGVSEDQGFACSQMGTGLDAFDEHESRPLEFIDEASSQPLNEIGSASGTERALDNICIGVASSPSQWTLRACTVHGRDDTQLKVQPDCGAFCTA